MTSPVRILVYLLRRDLRLADNPVFYEVLRLNQQGHSQFTHLLPLYVFSAQQLEVSGFIDPDAGPCPYPEARSSVGGFWRCGLHRARFIAESVFDLKSSLAQAGSGLEIRVGMLRDVVGDVLDAYSKDDSEVTVWMTGEEGTEEKKEEREIKVASESRGANFRLWTDEKYFIDDRDVPFKTPKDLPKTFTTYRKMVEPLRSAPRRSLQTRGKLPPLPDKVPYQRGSFLIPSTLEGVIFSLSKPLLAKPDLSDIAKWPSNAQSAHPFQGGESHGHKRIQHLIHTGAMTTYKETRNGMIGLDFSTKLSAWLSLGCITARQVHEYLIDFEDAKTPLGAGKRGYGKGENAGTGWVRFELLWRDYMRLCTKRYKHRLFRLGGFEEDTSWHWKHPQKDKSAREDVRRFLLGETSTGMIDASMRELWHTGWTSNRARQNVGSYLAKHLGIDWRIGAEWYESLLVDYDVSSNWGNWQAVSLTDRVFNPVKQSFDYDADGAYIKTWVEELRGVEELHCIFQAWKLSDHQKQSLSIDKYEYMGRPLKRIEFGVGRSKDRNKNGSARGGAATRGGFNWHYRGQRRRGAVDRSQPPE